MRRVLFGLFGLAAVAASLPSVAASARSSSVSPFAALAKVDEADACAQCTKTFSHCVGACDAGLGHAFCVDSCAATFYETCQPKCASASTSVAAVAPVQSLAQSACTAACKEQNAACIVSRRRECSPFDAACYLPCASASSKCQAKCTPNGASSSAEAQATVTAESHLASPPDWYRDPCSARCAGTQQRCRAAFPDAPGCTAAWNRCFMYECQTYPMDGDADLPCFTNCYATFHSSIPGCQVGDMDCFAKLAGAYQHCAAACPQPAWMPKVAAKKPSQKKPSQCPAWRAAMNQCDQEYRAYMTTAQYEACLRAAYHMYPMCSPEVCNPGSAAVASVASRLAARRQQRNQPGMRA